MFIKNSFQTTALVWIPSLGKKPDLQSGKNRFAMEKAIQTRRFKENIALRAGWKGWKGFKKIKPAYHFSIGLNAGWKGFLLPCGQWASPAETTQASFFVFKLKMAYDTPKHSVRWLCPWARVEAGTIILVSHNDEGVSKWLGVRFAQKSIKSFQIFQKSFSLYINSLWFVRFGRIYRISRRQAT